jgi:hypothetical protein
MTNTQMDELCMHAFSNVASVLIDNCHIHQLVPSGIGRPLHNVTLIHIKSTHIKFIRSQSLYGITDVASILFEDSSIRELNPLAFAQASNVQRMLFVRTSIDYIFGNAFKDAHIRSVLFDSSGVDKIASDAFALLTTDTLTFTHSTIAEVHARAFSQLRADTLLVHVCKVGRWDEDALDTCVADVAVNITGNTFARVRLRMCERVQSYTGIHDRQCARCLEHTVTRAREHIRLLVWTHGHVRSDDTARQHRSHGAHEQQSMREWPVGGQVREGELQHLSTE